VLRCLRVDRVTVAITHFVSASLGPEFVQPPVLEYANVLRQSNERTPIVFVLSPGADPAYDIFKLGAPSWLQHNAEKTYACACVAHAAAPVY